MNILKVIFGKNSRERSSTNYIYCRRCGRKLKSENSKLLGIGSSCYKKEVGEKQLKLF